MKKGYTLPDEWKHPLDALLGNTDIYLIDQIMKGRYSQGDRVLDAGCGAGRNLHWFVANGVDVYAVDRDSEAIAAVRTNYPTIPHDQLFESDTKALPFRDGFFDAVISSAVLHFAASEEEFFTMFGELVRVTKPGGTLFIRMTTMIGIEGQAKPVQDGIYDLQDGSRRFLLTRTGLARLTSDFPVSLAEDFKTVVVNDVRSMATLLLRKEKSHRL